MIHPLLVLHESQVAFHFLQTLFISGAKYLCWTPLWLIVWLLTFDCPCGFGHARDPKSKQLSAPVSQPNPAATC